MLEALWRTTGRAAYRLLFRYWLKIFTVAFAMGVVSGLVMSYQFGTNWSVFADRTGPVLGPPMAYEVLSAFFLEAGFLGIMVFGMERVGKNLHFLATLMVAAGTVFSAFWILSANSWMHTPAGFALNDVGQFVPTDWWAVIFNPFFSLSTCAHGARRLSDDGVRGRGSGRVPPAAELFERAGTADAVHGDVDGRPGCSRSGDCRRSSRTKHAQVSTGQDRRHGRAFPDSNAERR